MCMPRRKGAVRLGIPARGQIQRQQTAKQSPAFTRLSGSSWGATCELRRQTQLWLQRLVGSRLPKTHVFMAGEALFRAAALLSSSMVLEMG